MIEETCPRCGYAKAERQDILAPTVGQPTIGNQLFCPSCRYYSSTLLDAVKPDPARVSAHAKLKKLGLSDEELQAIIPGAVQPATISSTIRKAST